MYMYIEIYTTHGRLNKETGTCTCTCPQGHTYRYTCTYTQDHETFNVTTVHLAIMISTDPLQKAGRYIIYSHMSAQ
jgi:hypothetical protein